MRGSITQMRELRTQEGNKFKKIFEIVRAEAKKRKCIFFLDCGEGRELFTEDMEGEDLSGWLIPESEADAFQKEFDAGDVSEKWNENVFFASWKKDQNGISIAFESF